MRPITWRSRLRRFGLASVVAHLVILAVACALAFTVLLLSNQPLGLLPAAVAYTWLAGHTVPISDGTVTISVFPLLGVMGVIAGVAAMIRYTVKKRVSVTDLSVMIPMFLVVPLLVTIAMWAVLRGADFHASLPVALGTVVAVDAIAIVLGMGSALWRALCRKYGIPKDIVYGFEVASRFAGWLAIAAAVALVVSLVWHHEAIVQLQAALGEGSAFGGLVGISVLYAINAIVSIMAVLVGGEVSFGPAVASVFSAELAPMPAVPLLAAWPASAWTAAWALFLVPLGIAIACTRRIPRLPGKSWRIGVSAVVWVAVLAGILSWLVRGEVGIYGSLRLWSVGFMLLSAAWVAAGVVAVLLVDAILARRAVAAVPEEFRSAPRSEDEAGEEFSAENEEQEADVDMAESDAVIDSDHSADNTWAEDCDADEHAVPADVAETGISESVPAEHQQTATEEPESQSGEEDASISDDGDGDDADSDDQTGVEEEEKSINTDEERGEEEQPR